MVRGIMPRFTFEVLVRHDDILATY